MDERTVDNLTGAYLTGANLIGDSLTVDPALVAHSAGQILDAGLRLDEQRSGHRAWVSPEFFDGLGDRLTRELTAASEDAAATLDQLVSVLHNDVDRLYRTAFAAQEAQDASIATTSTAFGSPG